MGKIMKEFGKLAKKLSRWALHYNGLQNFHTEFE
jgi:hypothetical protein